MAYIVYKDNTSHYVFAKQTGTASEINPNRIIENQPSYLVSAIKEQARLASPINVNLSAQHTFIDGIALSNGDRVLLIDQMSAKENGIYFWDAGHRRFFRSQDCFELKSGMFIMIEEGVSLRDGLFFLSTNNPIIVDETPLSFVQITGGLHALTHSYGATDPVDGDKVGIDWVPTNYTPNTSSPLVTLSEHLGAHLAGIDEYLGTPSYNSSPIYFIAGVSSVDASSSEISLGAIPFDPSDYALITTLEFVVVLSVSDTSLTGTAKLYNITDREFITGGSISTSSTDPTKFSSGALTIGVAAGEVKPSEKLYQVWISVTGSGTGEIAFLDTAYFQVS